jgi:cell division protein FtsB
VNIYFEMKESFFRRPYLATLILVGLFTACELAFLTRTVLAQAAPTPDTGMDTLKAISLGVLFFNGLAFVVGFIWYIVKGKSTEQQAATIRQLETSNADYRAQNADLRLQKAEFVAEIKELEHECEKLRKKNLRLQGEGDQ